MDNQSLLNTIDIRIIGATPLVRFARNPKYTIFIVIIADIKKALILKKYTNPTIKVLVDYYKYLEVFLRKEADKLVEY